MHPSRDFKHYDHIVAGGGLVGALWALFLRRRSHSIAIFESYQDLRQELIAEGRSINLILSKRGVDALDRVGIKYEVLEHATVIRGRAIHTPDNQIAYLPYGTFEYEVSYCISRNKLNQVLLTIAENNNIDLYFRHSLEDADFNSSIFTFANDEETVRYSGTFLYGADGANSKVRDLINRETGGSEKTQWFEAEYKELFMPADENGHHLMDAESVHLWPRGKFLMMGQPNLNGTFSLTLILPTQGEVNFSDTKEQQKIEKFLQESFPDVYEKIPNAAQQFLSNPIGYFGTLYTDPWNYGSKAVLIGDAAHTIVPFLWQAVNVGFNDCVVLDSIIEKYGFAAAFPLYAREQKPNGDAIAKLSVENFEKLADPIHILKKKIEIRISQMFPHSYCSRYRAVFYGDYSYKQAGEISDRNDQILEQLALGIQSANEVDIGLAEKLLATQAHRYVHP